MIHKHRHTFSILNSPDWALQQMYAHVHKLKYVLFHKLHIGLNS